ncbi:MAG: hypothetical protein H0V96_13100 [Acidimicrobiia bacterium]|nr:hypothetical protein [Acidimicrobiia bacterium]
MTDNKEGPPPHPIFMFRTDGLVNAVLPIGDINWPSNANGVIHNALGVIGVDAPPAVLADTEILGVSLWEWFAGPPVAVLALCLLVTWTTISTMMLIFLAGLQGIPQAVEEAAIVDGASPLQRSSTTSSPPPALTVRLAGISAAFGEAPPWNTVLAGTLITSIPIAIVFFVFQRYPVQGLAATGTKG